MYKYIPGAVNNYLNSLSTEINKTKNEIELQNQELKKLTVWSNELPNNISASEWLITMSKQFSSKASKAYEIEKKIGACNEKLKVMNQSLDLTTNKYPSIIEKVFNGEEDNNTVFLFEKDIDGLHLQEPQSCFVLRFKINNCENKYPNDNIIIEIVMKKMEEMKILSSPDNVKIRVIKLLEHKFIDFIILEQTDRQLKYSKLNIYSSTMYFRFMNLFNAKNYIQIIEKYSYKQIEENIYYFYCIKNALESYEKINNNIKSIDCTIQQPVYLDYLHAFIYEGKYIFQFSGDFGEENKQDWKKIKGCNHGVVYSLLKNLFNNEDFIIDAGFFGGNYSTWQEKEIDSDDENIVNPKYVWKTKRQGTTKATLQIGIPRIIVNRYYPHFINNVI